MASREYDERYRKFIAAVKKRDKNKCQFPGCRRRTKLQTHHIIRWANNNELRYEVGNGILLCRSCHEKIKNKEPFYVDMFLEIVRRNNDK